MKQEFLLVAFVAVIGMSLLLQLYTVGFVSHEPKADLNEVQELMHQIVQLQTTVLQTKEQLNAVKPYAAGPKLETVEVLLKDLSDKQQSLNYLMSLASTGALSERQFLTVQEQVGDLASQVELVSGLAETEILSVQQMIGQ